MSMQSLEQWDDLRIISMIQDAPGGGVPRCRTCGEPLTNKDKSDYCSLSCYEEGNALLYPIYNPNHNGVSHVQ